MNSTDDFWRRLHSAMQVVTLRNVIVLIVLGVSAVAIALPFVWMVAVSVQPNAAANRLPPDYFPTHPDFSAYRDLFLDPQALFLKSFSNSLIIATTATLGVVISSAMAAFAFSRLEFRGRGPLLGLMLLGLMVPYALVMIPLFFQFARLGLLGSLWSLIIPSMMSPLGVYMLRQFMLAQPRELEEAALIEGAGYWSIFRRISLPQMAPAIASLGIITFTQSWNNFLLPLIFVNSPERMTLPLAIFNLGYRNNAVLLPTMMAAVTLAIAPLFIVFLVAQRFIVEGMAGTGIKG